MLPESQMGSLLEQAMQIAGERYGKLTFQDAIDRAIEDVGLMPKQIVPVPVKSSNIDTIAYDPASQTLEVLFKNGGLYQYVGVNPAVHRTLMAEGTESKGQFLAQHIKGRYEYKQISPEDSILKKNKVTDEIPEDRSV